MECDDSFFGSISSPHLFISLPVSYPPQAKWQVEEFAPSDQVTAQMPQPNAAHSSSLPLTLCLLRFLFLDRRAAGPGAKNRLAIKRLVPRARADRARCFPWLLAPFALDKTFLKHLKGSDYACSYVWQQHFNFAFRRLNSCSSPRAESGSGVKLRLAQRRCRGAESIKSSLVLWCRRKSVLQLSRDMHYASKLQR